MNHDSQGIIKNIYVYLLTDLSDSKRPLLLTKNLVGKNDFDFDQVDEKPNETIHALLNIMEQLVKVTAQRRQDNQRLRDEMNRLKGKPDKPNIKPKRKSISSEKEQKNIKNNSGIRLDDSATYIIEGQKTSIIGNKIIAE